MEAARLRVLGLVDPALDAIEKALTDPDVDIRLKAAREVLERVVPRHGSLAVTVATVRDASAKSASEIVSERLDMLAAAAAIQGEIVKYQGPGSGPTEIIEGEVTASGQPA